MRVYEAATDLAEAQWMVDEIQATGAHDGFARKEIAVLYRSNAQSRVIESALFNASVPYRVYGGLRFFERAEIKHALAYLRLLENPNDDTSFLRVVNFPPRGIGARSIEVLQDAARAAGCSLHDAVSAVPGKAGTNFKAFVAMIDVLREQTEGQSLRGIIEQMLESSGLVEHLPHRKGRRRPHREPAGTGQRRRELRHCKKALAAMPWPCRWMSTASRSASGPPKARSARAWTRTPPAAGRAAQARQRHRRRRNHRRRHRRNPLARWSPSSPMPRWRRATTRPRPGKTPCSS